MSDKKRNKMDRDKESVFLDRLTALSSSADELDESALEEDLRECGIELTELQKVAHDRLRRLANHNYITLEKECPPKLGEFLRQMRPPTEEEQHKRENSKAISKISDLLSTIRSGITSALSPPESQITAPAAAFRNKKKELTQKDRDLLESQQSEIDSEAKDKDRGDK